jgi:Plavaka transposase
MPEKAGEWKTRQLSFSDTEDKIFFIRHRNPISAIKSLWQDVQLSPEMRYAGQKIFSDRTQQNRIFSEMWTGKWWHVVQVSFY